MPDDYPYCELEVFVAGYERGRSYAASSRSIRSTERFLTEELATRRLTLYDLTREGLMMLGLRAPFVPREIFDAGVRRGLSEPADAT